VVTCHDISCVMTSAKLTPWGVTQEMSYHVATWHDMCLPSKVRTRLAESYFTLPSDDVALPRTAVHDGLGHIQSETGIGFHKTPNHDDESQFTSRFLAEEEPTHETDQQRRRTEWRPVRRLFPNRRPQQMAFCSAVAQQRFCSAFCWAAACSDDPPVRPGCSLSDARASVTTAARGRRG